MRKTFRGAPIFTIVSLLMVVAMIAMLFVPYWQTEVKEKNEEGKKVDVVKEISISEFTWFPKDYKDLQKDYEKQFDVDFIINDEVTMPALLLVLGVTLCIFSLARINSALGSLSALGLGIFSTYSYLTSNFLKTGLTWQTNLIVSIAATAVGLISTIVFLVFFIRKLQAERAALK